MTDGGGDDGVAGDQRHPGGVGEPQQPVGLEARGHLRADDDAPRQHQHAHGAHHHEQHALQDGTTDTRAAP